MGSSSVDIKMASRAHWTEIFSPRQLVSSYWPWIALVIFLTSGVLYGTNVEGWSFIQALLYAISAMSTGGLEAPTATTDGMWFTGFFCLFGCPLYGVLLAQLASRITEMRAKMRKLRIMQDGFQSDDAEYLKQVTTLCSGKSAKIRSADFVELYLVKLEMVDVDDIQSLRQKFEEIDVNGNGYLSKEEMYVEIVFSRWDTSGEGSLCEEEFTNACKRLLETSALPGVQQIMQKQIEEVGFGSTFNQIAGLDPRICRKDFMRWWRNLSEAAYRSSWYRDLEKELDQAVDCFSDAVDSVGRAVEELVQPIDDVVDKVSGAVGHMAHSMEPLRFASVPEKADHAVQTDGGADSSAFPAAPESLVHVHEARHPHEVEHGSSLASSSGVQKKPDLASVGLTLSQAQGESAGTSMDDPLRELGTSLAGTPSSPGAVSSEIGGIRTKRT